MLRALSRKKGRWRSLQDLEAIARCACVDCSSPSPAVAFSPKCFSRNSFQPTPRVLPAARGSLRPWLILGREAHTEGLYIHHTSPGCGRDSAAVSIGVVHALERHFPGMGYFRPIDKTTIGGDRALLMKEIYGFEDEVESMRGVTQQRAMELFTQNKDDDLMEEIFKAHDVLKQRHDFVLVEGTNLKGFGGDVLALNAKMASMLGASALFFTDARGAVQGNGPKRNAAGYQQEVLESVKMSDIVFRREKVDLVGTVVHGMPAGIRNIEVLKKLFKDIQVPFAGAIPDDPLLHSVQVQDVMRTLDAELLYGVKDYGNAMSTEVTNYIVATLQLSDLLRYLPPHSNTTKGCVVISDSSRSDILLSLLHLRESKSFPNVAALVLTGGLRPMKFIEDLVADASKGFLPVLLSPLPSFETAALLSRVEPAILSDSHLKIERAQLIFEDYVDVALLTKALLQERPIRMNPKLFQHNLFERAKTHKQHIVLPEGEEPRVVQAAADSLRRDLCDLTLLGDKEKIMKIATQLRVDIRQAHIINPADSQNLQKYADFFHEQRKAKGVSREQALAVLIEDVNYFGTCMVALGDADGMVSGAVHTTANTVRPALQIIKTPPHLPLVSSVFFMCLPDKVLVYGDCAINSDPTSEQLATIAIQSADTAAAFGIEPRVALLSYATGTSNTGPLIQKVIDATAIARQKRPDLLIEGPLQYDAAVDPEIARTKMKTDSPVAGKATVLIFPDLNTGNNTYKAVQQSTGAIAMGPLLQGLLKPVNDLSRGCTPMDIMTTIALTAVQSSALKNRKPDPKLSSEVAA